jgi:hypothetical protein
MHVYVDFLTKLSSYTNVQGIMQSSVSLVQNYYREANGTLQSGKTFHRIREGLWLTWNAAQKVGINFLVRN